MKYTVTLTAVFRITAENVVQARRAASRIRAIGENTGAARSKHNRDAVVWSVDKVSEVVRVERGGK